MKVQVTTDGEANFWRLARPGNWLARVQFNGELTNQEQEILIKRMAKALRKEEEEMMSLEIDLIESSPHSVFDASITANLWHMATVAGIGDALWNPSKIGIVKAVQLAAFLSPAIVDMKNRPDYYRQFDSSNKWGTYDDFVSWLVQLLGACLEHPNAEIEVS